MSIELIAILALSASQLLVWMAIGSFAWTHKSMCSSIKFLLCQLYELRKEQAKIRVEE